MAACTIREKKNFGGDELFMDDSEHGARIGGIRFARDDDLLRFREAEIQRHHHLRHGARRLLQTRAKRGQSLFARLAEFLFVEHL